MTETIFSSAHTDLSATTRLVNRTLSVLENCGCGDRADHSKTVCVLRSFDGRSRKRAHEIRARLQGQGVAAFTAAVPTVALTPDRFTDQHVCLHIDADEGLGEADRIAALTRIPLVTLTPPLAGGNTLESTAPALRAHFGPALEDSSHGPFPSFAGRVPGVAFDSFQITPNQPETGELSVRVGEVGTRPLRPGTSIRFRCLPDAILVEASDSRGETVTWLRQHVEVRQYSGIHRVDRDGISVTDLKDTMIVRHDPRAVRRHHA